MKVKSPGTTNQKRRIVLAALYILSKYQGVHRPHKQRVLDFVRSAGLMHIPPRDENYRLAGEEVWKHDLSWARNALRDEGLLRMPERGIWEITELGERGVQAWAQRVKKTTDGKQNWVSDFKAHSGPEAEFDEEFHYEYYITEETVRWALKIATDAPK
ncbi:MAG: winged helix-turn-helix domain-containing protein [Verrucomicrobiota bacterium]|jgi:restriction endonuclease Mrr